VRYILERARSRRPSASGGLIVLASCFTDVTEADYDEALTLATAFLSAGAAGVVAARWRIPETDTALFMLMFHQHLNGPFPDPSAALRATQSWMLDPARPVPEDWPDSLRRRGAERALAGPESWAGFAYQGR
jgi:CHAT domain-containing protein